MRNTLDQSSTELSVETSKTVYRVRIAHAHTLKEGWRVSETTVEATGESIDYNEIKRHMAALYMDGVAEAQRRTLMDRRVTGGS